MHKNTLLRTKHSIFYKKNYALSFNIHPLFFLLKHTLPFFLSFPAGTKHNTLTFFFFNTHSPLFFNIFPLLFSHSLLPTSLSSFFFLNTPCTKHKTHFSFSFSSICILHNIVTPTFLFSFFF